MHATWYVPHSHTIHSLLDLGLSYTFRQPATTDRRKRPDHDCATFFLFSFFYHCYYTRGPSPSSIRASICTLNTSYVPNTDCLHHPTLSGTCPCLTNGLLNQLRHQQH